MQVDFGEGPETEHRLHLTASGYSPFRHTRAGVPAIDPSLDQSTGASRNAHGAAQSHLLQSDNASSIVGGQLSHGFYGDMSRSSPIPPNASPARQPKQVVPTFVPDDRAPPPRDVSDETIGDAYAAFILYCNPNFPTTIDTSELVKLFRTPPKSDGNAFSIWTLFELIRKFDAKEITTWTKLALDLGVAPPDTEKGQSTQKVQQYSVRLKVREFCSCLLSLFKRQRHVRWHSGLEQVFLKCPEQLFLDCGTTINVPRSPPRTTNKTARGVMDDTTQVRQFNVRGVACCSRSGNGAALS